MKFKTYIEYEEYLKKCEFEQIVEMYKQAYNYNTDYIITKKIKDVIPQMFDFYMDQNKKNQYKAALELFDLCVRNSYYIDDAENFYIIELLGKDIYSYDKLEDLIKDQLLYEDIFEKYFEDKGE